MNKRILVLMVLCMACNPERSGSDSSKDTIVQDTIANSSDSLNAEVESNNSTDDSTYNEMMDFQTYHILTITEGYNFDSLKAVSKEVADRLNTTVDYMGRIYDPSKGIIVPPDDEDEIYRGEYFPRRFEGNTISIEMGYALADSTERIKGDRMKMVVVAGLFTERNTSDSILGIVKSSFPAARVITRDLYVGCMH
jgi:hypothetical protein